MTDTERTYQALTSELQEIITSLERDSTSMDELSEKLERGFIVLESLQKKLTTTETRIKEVIQARTS